MQPSSAEYWRIGAITMGLARFRAPTCIGANSLAEVIKGFLGEMLKRGGCRLAGQTEHANAMEPASVTVPALQSSACCGRRDELNESNCRRESFSLHVVGTGNRFLGVRT
jgi:hypothetical protein